MTRLRPLLASVGGGGRRLTACGWVRWKSSVRGSTLCADCNGSRPGNGGRLIAGRLLSLGGTRSDRLSDRNGSDCGIDAATCQYSQ